MATKKSVVLSRAWGFTKKEAEEFVKRMQSVGMIPATLQVNFATVPGGRVEVKQFRPSGSTAGARFLVREGRA